MTQESWLGHCAFWVTSLVLPVVSRGADKGNDDREYTGAMEGAYGLHTLRPGLESRGQGRRAQMHTAEASNRLPWPVALLAHLVPHTVGNRT